MCQFIENDTKDIVEKEEYYKYLKDTCLNSVKDGMVHDNNNSGDKKENKKNHREEVSNKKDENKNRAPVKGQ